MMCEERCWEHIRHICTTSTSIYINFITAQHWSLILKSGTFVLHIASYKSSNGLGNLDDEAKHCETWWLFTCADQIGVLCVLGKIEEIFSSKTCFFGGFWVSPETQIPEASLELGTREGCVCTTDKRQTCSDWLQHVPMRSSLVMMMITRNYVVEHVIIIFPFREPIAIGFTHVMCSRSKRQIFYDCTLFINFLRSSQKSTHNGTHWLNRKQQTLKKHLWSLIV